jgi:hypothetical protein
MQWIKYAVSHEYTFEGSISRPEFKSETIRTGCSRCMNYIDTKDIDSEKSALTISDNGVRIRVSKHFLAVAIDCQ